MDNTNVITDLMRWDAESRRWIRLIPVDNDLEQAIDPSNLTEIWEFKTKQSSLLFWTRLDAEKHMKDHLENIDLGLEDNEGLDLVQNKDSTEVHSVSKWGTRTTLLGYVVVKRIVQPRSN